MTQEKTPWQFTTDRAFTHLITPGDKKRITKWLLEHEATPSETKPGPRLEKFAESTDHWSLEGEPVFIHTKPNYETNKVNIRLDSSIEFADRLISEGVLPKFKDEQTGKRH